MTETLPPLLNPALSPRLPGHDVAEPQTGLDPAQREAVLAPEKPQRLVSLDAYRGAVLGALVAPEKPQRLVSLDAYRGLVMVLMVSAGLGIGRVVKNFDATPELNHLH